MKKFNWATEAVGLSLCAVVAIVLPMRTKAIAGMVTFTTLYSFTQADGARPKVALVEGVDGNLYGTTDSGGEAHDGTIFNITLGGILTSLYSFCESDCSNGFRPNSALVEDIEGNYYGTTVLGGENHKGTLYKIDANGEVTTIYSFCPHQSCPEPVFPNGVVQGADGDFYGTTQYGGENDYGSVFKITANGELTTIYSFNVTGGYYPSADLIQGTDRNFYGTTFDGGTEGDGTAFEITADGDLTTLHNFHGMGDGSYPASALIQGTDGNFYGTTLSGGTLSNDGTVFTVTAQGGFKTLHKFGGNDGDAIYAGLAEGTDGNFYGAAYAGGANDYGTLFNITPQGSFTTLHNFDRTDGKNPYATLVQDSDGTFYGTTEIGSARNHGSIFSLSVGLGAFVKTNPTSGVPGEAVNILGTNLTGATSVTFNGTPATFIVVSATEITTTVPAGATTGTVQVVTPNGALSSNVVFLVD